MHCIPTFCVSLPSFSFKVVVDGCMQHTNSFYFWSLMCFHHPRVGCNDYHCDYLIIDFVIANMIRVLNTVLYWVRQFCTPCPRFLHNVCNDNFVFTLCLNVFLLGLVMENLIMLVMHMCGSKSARHIIFARMLCMPRREEKTSLGPCPHGLTLLFKKINKPGPVEVYKL